MKISVWCGYVWTEARLNHGVIDGRVGRPPPVNWSSYWRDISGLFEAGKIHNLMAAVLCLCGLA